jgi:hypothetical protein
MTAGKVCVRQRRAHGTNIRDTVQLLQYPLSLADLSPDTVGYPETGNQANRTLAN